MDVHDVQSGRSLRRCALQGGRCHERNPSALVVVHHGVRCRPDGEESGGNVVKEPFDVMDVGRMPVIQDPTGAIVCLWKAKKHIGAGVVNEPGAITWHELLHHGHRAGRQVL